MNGKPVRNIVSKRQIIVFIKENKRIIKQLNSIYNIIYTN